MHQPAARNGDDSLRGRCAHVGGLRDGDAPPPRAPRPCARPTRGPRRAAPRDGRPWSSVRMSDEGARRVAPVGLDLARGHANAARPVVVGSRLVELDVGRQWGQPPPAVAATRGRCRACRRARDSSRPRGRSAWHCRPSRCATRPPGTPAAVRTTSWARLRMRSGSSSTTCARPATSSRGVVIPSDSTGARDSMPSTAMPSANLPHMSARCGSRAARSAARSRTWSVSSSSRTAGAHSPCSRDLERALVGDGERADLLDRVTPELDPQGVLLRGREDVEDAAADRDLPAPLDEVVSLVAQAHEGSHQFRKRRLVADHEANRAHIGDRRHDRLEEGTHRGHEHVDRQR